MSQETVLVVDDDRTLQVSLAQLLELEGYRSLSAFDANEALARMETHPVSVVLMDLMLPGADGLAVLDRMRDRWDVPVVIMTGYATIQRAVDAMRRGAVDFVTKPIPPEAVALILVRALSRRQLEQENARLKEEVASRYGYGSLVGKSPPMQQLFEQIKAVAPTDATVLITGETGTGKELVARSIHYNGPRRRAPFVAINCAALVGELFESELFGHAAGAFTGAIGARKGRFEEADHGTLFLDEIGLLPPGLQAKLLRVLQDRQIQPIGGGPPVLVDVRILAATNKDLHLAMRTGEFRDDLYYRLCVYPIPLVPLRARLEDLPLLAVHLLEDCARRAGIAQPELTPGALDVLLSYDWPGNVRELANVLERTFITRTGNVIDRIQLPSTQARDPGASQGAAADPARTYTELQSQIKQREKVYWMDLYRETEGKPAEIMRISGVSYQTLRRKLAEFGLKG